jgi:mRNA interferase MazF
MQRGDVVAVADRAGNYTGKPRPAVIVQSDISGALDSVTISPLTRVASDAPVIRLPIDPSPVLPLERASWIAADKVTTVRRNWIGASLGRLSAAEMQQLSGALAVFLGIG